jgi:hypothetical protein
VTTIAYDLPVKDLVDSLSATGHVTHTAYRKTSVTLHHNGGRLSHEGVLRVWEVRPASAHFDVDALGNACQYVKVNEYAWATGNTVGNKESINIEMANTTLSPDWLVDEITWMAAARLAGWLFARVIGVRPDDSNFFVHSRWSATTCAGPCINQAWAIIMSAAQASYDAFVGSPTPVYISVDVPAPPVHSGPPAWNPFGIPSCEGLQKLSNLYGANTEIDDSWGPKSASGFATFLRQRYRYVGNDVLGPIMWSAISRWLRLRWGYVGNNVPGPIMRAALKLAEETNRREL